MPTLYLITHPDVIIDPSMPVPDWPLSPKGVRRMSLALAQPWMTQLNSVFSSAERKAIDAAQLVADRFSLLPVVIPEGGDTNPQTSVIGRTPADDTQPV